MRKVKLRVRNERKSFCLFTHHVYDDYDDYTIDKVA